MPCPSVALKPTNQPSGNDEARYTLSTMTGPRGLPRCLFAYGRWSRNQVDESARHTLQWGPASLAMLVTIFLSLAQYTVLALFALVVGECGARGRRAWA